ncbi:MAG: hypothetical protein HY840_11320 [Bacteroidetes bacterium]|nr:hypothetical protein [Bacteroidota bacterium]
MSDFQSGWDGRSSPFYRAIISLKKDEGLFISSKEWNMYRTPSRICRYIEKKFPVKYQCKNHHDGSSSGWKVKRVE